VPGQQFAGPRDHALTITANALIRRISEHRSSPHLPYERPQPQLVVVEVELQHPLTTMIGDQVMNRSQVILC